MDAQIKNIERIKIRHAPGKQLAYPFLTRLDGGAYCMVCREAPYQKDKGHADLHPESTTAMIISNDPLNWENAQHIVIPGSEGAGQAPALHPLGGDRYMLLDYRWSFLTDATKPKESFREKSLGDDVWIGYGGAFSRLVTLENGGWSFGPERKIAAGEHNVIFTGPGALRTDDSAYIIPCYQREMSGYWDNEVFLLRTPDGGETWEQIGAIEKRAHKYAALTDTDVIATDSPDNMIALLRTTNKFDYMLQSNSTDGGRTWSTPERTEIQGHPPNIISLGDGAIVCIYAHSYIGRSIRLCVSRDFGKTWETTSYLTILDDFPAPDFGGGSTVRLPDGSFLTAFHLKDEDGEYHIQAARYELVL